MKVKGFDKFIHYTTDDAEGLWADFDGVEAEDWATSAHTQLSTLPARDPVNGQWSQCGFVCPLKNAPEVDLVNSELEGEVAQCLAQVIPGTSAVVLCVEKRERALPSSTISDKLNDRVSAFENREQRPANRKEWAILKDEVIATELTKAPIKRSRIYILLDLPHVYVFTGSPKIAEDITAMIRKVFGSCPVFPTAAPELLIIGALKSVLLPGDDEDAVFTAGIKGTLINGEGEKLSVSNSNMDEARYASLVQDEGFFPIELMFSLAPGDSVGALVRVNIKGAVKSFEPVLSGELPELTSGSDKDSRQADLWIVLQSLRNLRDAFVAAGIENDPDEEEL